MIENIDQIRSSASYVYSTFYMGTKIGGTNLLKRFQKEKITIRSIHFNYHQDVVLFSYFTEYMDSANNVYILNPHIKVLQYLYDLGNNELCHYIKKYIHNSAAIKNQYLTYPLSIEEKTFLMTHILGQNDR